MSDDIDRLEDELTFLDGLKSSKGEFDLEREDDEEAYGVAAYDVEWLLHSDALRKVKTVDRSLEMDVDMVLSGRDMIRFCDDVERHGLYEACLMLPNTKNIRNRIMDKVLVEYRLKSLSKRDIRTPKDFGIEVKSKKQGLRPESVWALQKHLIQNERFDVRAKKIFESVMPFSSPPGLPKPNTSSDFCKIAEDTSVWEAVVRAPIKYREALASRLLVLYAIPDPEPPKAPKSLRTKATVTRKGDRVLVIDKAGNAWTWDCGWGRVKEDGTSQDAMHKRLGHATFKRVVIPAGPEDYARTSFRYTRPWGQWRKGNGPVYSDIYKMNGELILTDGLHAVVEFADGVKREVMLENLQSISVRSARASKPVNGEKKPRAKKAKASMSLEDLLKML